MERKPSRQPRYPSLTQLATSGTFYDVGYNVGVNLGDHIKLFLAESDDVQGKLFPFYDSRPGRDYFEESLAVCEQCFPQYVREIRGMADGSGIPFEHLFFLNLSKEVYNVLYDEAKAKGEVGQQAARPELDQGENRQSGTTAVGSGSQDEDAVRSAFQENFGCSDVFINRPGVKYVIHNEDCDPMIKPYGYLLSADIQEDGMHEKFTAFCYPGVLPGTSCSFNMHGVIQTIDGLYADHIVRHSVNRHFINRATLAARDIPEACRIIENEPYGVAYGFCCNLSTVSGEMVAVEVGPAKPKAQLHVERIDEQRDPEKPCHYYHFNSYKHLKVKEMQELGSSVRRTQRANELPPPRDLRDALVVLGDTKDPLGPIFRTPRPTDRGETVCTCAFDVKNRQFKFWQGNPADPTNTPFLSMPMYV